MGNYDFGIDTEQMKKTAKAIQDDTDELEKQTNTKMSNLDDAYLNFPPGAANLAQTSQISLTAVLKRVRTEDSRISEILKAIAIAVEEEEKKLVQAFMSGTTPGSTSNPAPTPTPIPTSTPTSTSTPTPKPAPGASPTPPHN